MQLFHHELHGKQVLRLRPFLVHTGDEVSCTDIVEVIVKDVIASDITLLVNHLVGIHLTILQDIVTTITQVGVEHAFQFDTHDVTPFGLGGEVEHV